VATAYPQAEIASLATVHSGFAFKSRDWREAGIPVVKIANVKDGRLSMQDCSHVSAEIAEEADGYQLKEGDILVSMTGYIGEVARVRTNERMLLNQRVGRFTITDSEALDPVYFFYALKRDSLKAEMQAHAYGAAQPNISPALIGALTIPLPPLSLQHKIAAILSAYDDLIENNLRRMEILEEMAQLIYQEWFVKFHFPGHEKVRLVDSSLGKIPERWKPTAVSEAVLVNPPTRVDKDACKTYVPMAGLSTDSMLVSQFERRTGTGGTRFRNYDTLLARITPCLEHGKTAFVQFLASDDDVAIGSTEFIVLRSDTVSPYYVYFLARTEGLRQHAIKSMTGASGRQRVQVQCFDDYQFAHPDRDTLLRFSSLVAPMLRHIQCLWEANRSLVDARDLLLPRLVSGQLDLESVEVH
jgi:type I restriction enzyme S subunit